MGKDQSFTFDHVFNDEATQNTIYNDTVKPLVHSCLDGYNATVFAYGQTGYFVLEIDNAKLHVIV